MLLVIIALVVTTVLCAAALTSRDNSPAIGANASNTTKAQWSAVSGALFVTAAIEQHADVIAQYVADLALDVDKPLIDSMQIAGGNVQIRLLRPDGSPLQGDERVIRIRATGAVEGIDINVDKLHVFPPREVDLQDLDFSHKEFALYATESYEIKKSVVFANWELSPESAANQPIKMGAGFSSPSGFDLYPIASLGAVNLYLDAEAPSMLDAAADAVGIQATHQLPVSVPVINNSLPPALASLQPLGTNDLEIKNTGPVVLSDQAAKNMRVDNATLIIDADQHSDYYMEKLEIRGGSTVLIRGDVALYVHKEFKVQDASRILLAPGANLRVYFMEKVHIRSKGMIGLDENDTGTSWPSLMTYTSPARVYLIALNDTDASIVFEQESVIIGCVYAPLADFEIKSRSALIGRVTAANIKLHDRAHLFYDPALDSRIGITTLTGPLYNDNGTPIPGLVDALVAAETAVCLDDMTTFATNSLLQVMHSGEIVLEGADLLLGGSGTTELGGGGPISGPIGSGLSALGL